MGKWKWNKWDKIFLMGSFVVALLVLFGVMFYCLK